MVSFQCEGCGDVLTKKKLDSHRNQCGGAPFTCIDCMTTFRGTEYRAHTSCITEDQKYQGALYREKPSKAAKRKSVQIIEPNEEKAPVPRSAYVEDAYDSEFPPHVPSPPPAVPSDKADSVFDYMVEDESKGTPKIAFTENREEMSMKTGAPPLFKQKGREDTEDQRYSRDYEENGWSYGADPVNGRKYADTNGTSMALDVTTPAPKTLKTKTKDGYQPSGGHSRTNSGSEKKRKRTQADAVTTTPADVPMPDVIHKTIVSVSNAPAVVHSGLTGGLSRMLTDHEKAFPFRTSPSSDEHDDHYRREKEPSHRRALKTTDDPMSPSKRTRRTTKEDTSGHSEGLGISMKTRAVKALSMVGGALLPAGLGDSATKTRRRASSSDHGQVRDQDTTRVDEKRERKKHKVHRHNGTSTSHVRFEHSPRRRGSDERDDSHHHRRKLKAIEYKKDDSLTDSEDDRKKKGGNSQMVVFGAEEKNRRMCEMFLSNVPSTDVEKGYSVNKALKRWHKACEVRSTTTKLDEEKELWRHLRLRKNDRGEIVVFF